MNNFTEIEKLWLEFSKLSFPLGIAGEELEGIEPALLDTFTAGCIVNFVSSKGVLDEKNKSNLKISQRELEIVIRYLKGEAKTYFEKLLCLVNKILQNRE